MNVKARQQGNSIGVTFPKSFKIAIGTIFEPVKVDDGILFKYVEESDDFFDFDRDILKTLIDSGHEGDELIEEFIVRKKKFPEKIDKFLEEAKKETPIRVSREDF